MTMNFLTRDQILGANDLATRVVECPEWGGKVTVRALTGFERDKFEEEMLVQKGKTRTITLSNVRARLCALCVVDESGKKLFTLADITKLGEKSAAPLDRIFAVARDLSALSDEDVADITKNSSSGQSEDSGSN